MNTNITGPWDWGVIFEFARASDRDVIARLDFLAWLKTIPLVLPCAKCRASSEAMMALTPPRQEVLEGRALAYVWQLKNFVNDKLGRQDWVLPLETFLLRAAVWKRFAGADVMLDTLAVKTINMGQRPEPLPRETYHHLILTLALARRVYQCHLPTVPSFEDLFTTPGTAFLWLAKATQQDAKDWATRLWPTVVDPNDFVKLGGLDRQLV